MKTLHNIFSYIFTKCETSLITFYTKTFSVAPFATVCLADVLYLPKLTAQRHHCMIGKSRLSTSLPFTWILVLPFRVVWSWASHFIFPCLSFLICAMGILIIPTSQGIRLSRCVERLRIGSGTQWVLCYLTGLLWCQWVLTQPLEGSLTNLFSSVALGSPWLQAWAHWA